MAKAYALRSGNSGPLFDGNEHDVLTLGADGKAVFMPPSGTDDHTVAVTASDQVPDFLNSKLASTQGVVLSLLNPGGNEQISIGLSPNPSFSGELDAGNKTGAATVDVGANCVQRITLTGNTTLTINGKQTGRAQWYQFKVIQGGAGSFTLTIAGAQTPGGLGLALSTAVGAKDLISVYYDGAALFAQVSGLAFA